MSILKEGWNRISGAFKVLMGSAAAVGLLDIIKGLLKEKGVEAGVEFIKTLATGKGLENEAVYGYILDRCSLKTDERMFLVRAIEELRIGTEKEVDAANNFIILVALGNPDKNGRRPGEKIIHGFIHRIGEYSTEDEKIRMIKDNVIHIGTNAEVCSNVSAAKKWAAKVWAQEIRPLINQLNVGAKDFRDASKKALDDFDKRPLWRKLFLN